MKRSYLYKTVAIVSLVSATATSYAACVYGPDTCLPGFVWREASQTDHVCVTVGTRDQTRNDNSLENQRKAPGPFGTDNCVFGFVWREAFPGDHVCVTGATREQAREDNAQVSARRDPQCANTTPPAPPERVCASTIAGTPPITHLGAGQIALGQTPGRQVMEYLFQNDNDVALLIIDDAPRLRRDQTRIEIDIDPVGMPSRSGVTWNKAIEVKGLCPGKWLGTVEASKDSNACSSLSDVNDFRSGCTRTQSILIDLSHSQSAELWLRKPGFLGIWYDVEVLDSTFFSAFGGRSVRFIWRAD